MSPRPQFPPEEVEARRQAILASTIDQIAVCGADAVRMKDVAAGAGVSVGTVQYYFSSRENLLVQAFTTHGRAVIGAIEDLSASPGTTWERLRSTFRAVPAVGSHQRRSAVWIELIAAARRNPYLRDSLAEVFVRWRTHLRTLIDAGVAEGVFEPRVGLGLIVDTIIAQIDGFDLAVAAGRDDVSPARITHALEATAAALLGVSAAVAR